MTVMGPPHVTGSEPGVPGSGQATIGIGRGVRTSWSHAVRAETTG